MRRTKEVLGGIFIVSVALGLALVPQLASSPSPLSLSQDSAGEPIPAFHNTVPDGPLPSTLSPSTFDDALAQNAYSLAARIKKVLYQEPCYCHCDRSQGHGSLLDCFVSKHAAVCGVCEREAFYSYEQSRKGKTAAQIREGIVRGDWQQLDITKYQTPLPAPSK